MKTIRKNFCELPVSSISQQKLISRKKNLLFFNFSFQDMMVVMDEVHMMISEEAVLVTAVASEWAEAVAALEWPEVAASEWAEVLAPAEWEVIYFCLILNILLFSRKKKNKYYKNNYIFRCWPKRSNKPCGSYARFAFPRDRK